MRFLWSLTILTSLLAHHCIALSNHATAILDRMTTISHAANTSHQAISQYNGGMTAAIPLGRGFYRSWSAIRAANVNLNPGSLSPEESDAVMQEFNSMNEIAVSTLTAHTEKAQLFHNAKISFVAPIFLQAIDRETKNYGNALKTQLSNTNHTASLEAMLANYNNVWDAAFAAFASDYGSSSDLPGFLSVLTPVLKYLP